jgi:hypothetical protein
VRLHAVLDSLAGPATPRCSGVHGRAGLLDRPAGLHVASCATSVLDPGPPRPREHLKSVAACGGIFHTAARSRLLLFAAIAALVTFLLTGPTLRPAAAAVLPVSDPEVVAPAASDPIVQRRASPLREASPRTLDFTGGTRR